MLAYISWHRPRQRVDVATYEGALERFHRSLARRPPSGFERLLRISRSRDAVAGAPSAQDPPGTRAGYEDWYLLEDWAALGVLEEAAVAHGHVSPHDEVARSLSGVATGGRLPSGRGRAPGRCRGDASRCGCRARQATSTARSASPAGRRNGSGRAVACGAAMLVLGPAPELLPARPRGARGRGADAPARTAGRRSVRSSAWRCGSADAVSARAPATFATLALRRRDWRSGGIDHREATRQHRRAPGHLTIIDIPRGPTARSPK